MKPYDFFFLIPGALAEGEMPMALESVKALLQEAGAENSVFVSKGRQKLAYPVKANHFAYLVESSFSLAPEKMKNLQDKLRLESEVLRFMISDHQAKEHRRVRPAVGIGSATAAKSVGKEQVDLQAIDKKIDEILQQDKIVI